MSASIGTSPISLYVTYSANEAKYAQSASVANPQDNGLLSYFKENAAGITSPAALMKDYKALSVVLGAFGLSSLVNSTALLKQLLTQNPSSTTSTAYRIGNAKYLTFAKALQTWSPAPFSTASGIDAIVTAYQQNSFEKAVDAQTPGLQRALYFTRTASGITSRTQLQSDPDLLAVAVSGLGLPLTAFQNLTFSQQTTLLTNKLNVADLKKPSYVQHLAEQYLVQQQLANGPTGPSTPQAGSLLNAFSGSDTTGNGLLGILQSSSGSTNSVLGSSTSGTNTLLSLFA